MEVFTVDRQIRNDDDVDFPVHLTPFPDAADVLYNGSTAEIRPLEMGHHSQQQQQQQQQLPPQKLRPIRCNSRTTLSEYPDPMLLGCHGELGFLTQLSLANGSGVSVPGNCGGVYGGNPYPLVDVTAMQRMNMEMNGECVNLMSDERLFEAGLRSLSSDDDGDSSEAMTEPLNRKRKRKTRKKIELFLENMMRKVIQKQEQMHKQLIEMIEKKERERIIREEAWKQQEIERAKKEEEIRAQERYRSLALISFIQNLLGHEIQIPKSWESSCLEKVEGKIHNQKDLTCDPFNKRWPKSEVQALITVRSALDHKFLKGPKGNVWEEVAVGMSNVGYVRSGKKCKEKWENINKYYRRTMETGKKRPNNVKTCPYFHELDILYKNGLSNPGIASHFIRDVIEDKSTQE